MLTKSISHEMLFCEECKKWIIYKIINGTPFVCPRCGVPANVSLTQEQRMQMEQMQHNRGPQGQSFTIRMG